MKINGYSTHADHNGLLNWLKAAQERSKNLKQVFLVHGEIDNTMALTQVTHEQDTPQVHIPDQGESFKL